MLKSTHRPIRTLGTVLGHIKSRPSNCITSHLPTYIPALYRPVHKDSIPPGPFSSNIRRVRRTGVDPTIIGKPSYDYWQPEYPEEPHPGIGDIAQRIATGDIPRFGMASVGNRADAAPKHEMVYFKGLLNTERRFGDFRTVLHTGLYGQVVAMEVPVDGEIGDEVHTVDQILLFTSGRGLATVAGRDQEVVAGDVIVVPAGTQHQFITQGDQPLELVTIYAPAEHNQQTVHKTKEEGDKAEDEGRDEAPAWSRKSKKENEDAGVVRLDAKYDNE